MSIEFRCHASSKHDCHLWVLMPKKERCKGCEIYGTDQMDNSVECSPDYCPNYAPRCRYDVDGECTSSVYRAWAMKRELKNIGIDAEFKGLKEENNDNIESNWKLRCEECC